MRRFVKTLILFLLLCAMALSMIACGDSFEVQDDFKATTGTAKEGGFVAETDSFYYVINGIGDIESDNEFGKALGKGSLLAVNKTDLTKSAVVVPKLFVGADYNAGVYIFDGRVYFATSSTDKELSGAVKSSTLVFASCKLDGADYIEYATTNSLSTEFRIVEKEEAVLIIYYDELNKALVEYNTNSNASKTIIKTDAKEKESLSAYKFFDNSNLEKGVVAYTVDVYTKDLIDGSRGNAENYNKIYVYKAGADKAEVYKDGNKNSALNEKYTINSIVNGEIVYTVTTINDAKGVTYHKGESIDSAKFDVSYLYVGDNFYTLNKDKTEITKDDKTFAKASDVTTLLFVKDDYVYYLNAESNIARIKQDTDDKENKSEVLTKNAIATPWYNPVLKNNFIFYCDSSSTGGSNVRYIDLSASELQVKFLIENKFAEISERIDNLSSFMTAGRIDDLEELAKELDEIDDLYDGLNEEEKASISEKYDGLNVTKEAVRLSKLCEEKLKDINTKLTNNAKIEYQTSYDEIRAEFTKLEEKGQDYLTSVCNLMEQNSYYWFYYAKTNIFEKA